LRIILIGGAGFIGSNFAEHLLGQGHLISVFDNFSVGKKQFLAELEGNPKFRIIEGDARNKEELIDAFQDQDLVMHFVANADISLSTKYPTIDFDLGVNTTIASLEAIREVGIKKLIFFSGSGVYGDAGEELLTETYAPLEPISLYGASKLACESFICAYAHSFGINAYVFRMGNVVGGKQTHGVGYDFLQKLETDKNKLKILGDGHQSKTYIHVSDVIDGVMTVFNKNNESFSIHNLSSLDWISVNEIADICCNLMGINHVEYNYTGGSIGWIGDVPKVRLDTSKIQNLGWSAKYNSSEAVRKSIEEMILIKPWRMI